MKPADFCIPVYLNQSIVFDLLAIAEDGFAQVSSIRTSESSKNKGEGGIGASNVFALLGVSLKGEKSGEANREITHERIHTPASLFAKARARLNKEHLVHDLVEKPEAIASIKPGSFVEVEVTLRRNPLIESLQAMAETVSGINVLIGFGETPRLPAGKAKEKAQTDPMKQVADQARKMVAALRTGGSLDFIGQISSIEASCLVTAETRYFAENWAEEIGDGHFRVLGKVIRNISGPDQSISLLRNTPFAHIAGAIEPMKGAVEVANESGMTLPHIVTDVTSPALHILPIAIFL